MEITVDANGKRAVVSLTPVELRSIVDYLGVSKSIGRMVSSQRYRAMREVLPELEKAANRLNTLSAYESGQDA
jgi:hypothetical protein